MDSPKTGVINVLPGEVNSFPKGSWVIIAGEVRVVVRSWVQSDLGHVELRLPTWRESLRWRWACLKSWFWRRM